MEPQDVPPSLERAFRLSVESAQAVSDEANGVDAKIIGVFGIASAIVGIAASVATNLVGPRFYWPNLLFYLAVAIYVWVCSWTFWGLKRRTFYLPPNPRVLREEYWNLSEQEFLRRVYEFAEMAYQEHYHHLTVKSHCLIMVLPGLLFEVALLLGWAFFRAAAPIS